MQPPLCPLAILDVLPKGNRLLTTVYVCVWGGGGVTAQSTEQKGALLQAMFEQHATQHALLDAGDMLLFVRYHGPWLQCHIDVRQCAPFFPSLHVLRRIHQGFLFVAHAFAQKNNHLTNCLRK